MTRMGASFYIYNTAGAFVHNNGTMTFTASSPQVAMVSSGSATPVNYFYNIT